jgi:hypothetical protein
MAYVSVAHWGWLEEGSFRWSVPSLIQDGHHLGFPLLFWPTLGSTGQDFLVAHWGWLEEGSFLSGPSSNVAATATIFDLSIIRQTPASTGSIFCGLLGVLNLHPKPHLRYTHRQLPTREHMPRFAQPLLCDLHMIMRTQCTKFHWIPMI